MTRPSAICLSVLAGALALVAACGGGGGSSAGPRSVVFLVENPAGMPVIGAVVYLVPAGDIDETPFSGDDINNGLADDRDEPLEDAVRLHGGGYPQAMTDTNGRAEVMNVPAGRYFWFVQPGPGDAEHLPGGSGCRVARHTSTFLGLTVSVEVTSQPQSYAAANYVGTTACLSCHPAYAAEAEHAHRLGFSVPGQFTALQDPVRYPLFQDGWNRFLPAAAFTGGTVVWYSDYDPTRGFDKFKTSLSDPSPAQTVFVKAWLWRDTADQKFKITLENVINPADPRSPWTLEVPLTYGGAVFKQRLLVRVPGRNGLYPLLQYQTLGDESRFDRTRKMYRDYHLDWFWDDVGNLLKDPPNTKNFEGNCTACHSTGFVRFQDPVTQEWLSDAVNDPAGVIDIDGDGSNDEINLGCEVCHGPGNDHVLWAADPGNQGREARYIVAPEYLSPSREMMICGRCHDRPRGNGPVQNDEPLNPQGEMAPPGTSRADYLAEYTVRAGPTAGSLWSDNFHSKSHRQQYADMLKSTMHRNDRILTTCSDCHDAHGFAPFRHHVTADPDDANSNLCARCHTQDPFSHMMAQTGSVHAGAITTCIRCHMPKTAKTGAGLYGILLGTPTGTSSDPSITYFENDNSSHLFLTVPRKTHPDVAGVLPGSAMPIPYTASCGGPCHDAAPLQFQSPVPWMPVEGPQPAWSPLQPGPSCEVRCAHEPDDYGSEDPGGR